MKKVLMFVLVCLLGLPLVAQETDKSSASVEPSPQMTAIQTAYSLARYGYSTSRASALIGAAEILIRTQTQPLGVTPERDQGGAASEAKDEKPEFTPADLLATARQYAAEDGDNTMLAWANSVQRELDIATAGNRGAAGGPKYTIETVQAFSTDRYVINFNAGQLAQVYVSGDGDTDLDLYVYDMNGNLVVYDEGYTDECLVRWIPARTGAYTIVIKNLGRVWNRYYITTN